MNMAGWSEDQFVVGYMTGDLIYVVVCLCGGREFDG